MAYQTRCCRCGTLYAERSREVADAPCWGGYATALCPTCATERRVARNEAGTPLT